MPDTLTYILLGTRRMYGFVWWQSVRDRTNEQVCTCHFARADKKEVCFEPAGMLLAFRIVNQVPVCFFDKTLVDSRADELYTERMSGIRGYS